jgi:hypothetical protein
LVKKYLNSLAQKLNTNISVGSVDVSLFNKLLINDLYIEDLHKDTLLYASLLTVDIADFSYKKKRIVLDEIKFSDIFFNLKKYENEEANNLNFIINYFSSSDTTKSDWYFAMNSVVLNNARFNYNNQDYKRIVDGVDYKHLALSDIDLKINKINLINKGVDCRIEKLNFKEQSGFVVDEFTSEAIVTPTGIITQYLKIKTPFSKVDGNVTFLTKSYSDLSNFIEDVNIKSYFNTTKVDFKDLTYFASALNGLDKSLIFEGEISGSISNLKGRKLSILLDDGTRFKGSTHISGLPNANDMFMYVKVKELVTTKTKLESIPLYPFNEGNFISLPNNFSHLGAIRFKGNFTGFYHDFVTYGKIHTSLGDLTTDISLKLKNGKSYYKGNLITNHFDLGKFSGFKKDIGDITMNINVDGEGFSKKELKANFTGDIKQIVIKNYEYNNVDVKGGFENQIFTGFVSVKDENVSFDFDGKIDLSKKIPKIKFVSNIEDAKLAKLNLVDSKKKLKTRFSTQLKVDLIGNSVDDIVGDIHFVNSRYNDKIDSIVVENVLINSKQKGGNKIITVKSDMLDATVNGAFKFTEVANYIDDFMNRYISVKNEKNDEMASLPNDIDFEIDLYNTELLSKLLLKGVKLSDNSVLSGNYSSKDNKLSVTAELETIDVYGTEIRKFEFKGEANDNTLSLIVDADKIFNNDSLYIDNFNITSVAGNDSAITNVVWVNDLISSKNEGDITLITNFNGDYNVSNKIVDSYVYISDSLWSINPMNEIVIDTGYFAINDFRIYSVTQSIIIDGELSNDPAQQLNLLMKDVSLLTFKRMIPEKVVSLEGIVNGSAAIKKQNEVMVFTSNLAFNNFEINNYLVGDGILQSEWNTASESLELDGKFYWEKTPTISFGGFYYPMKEDESLDLSLELYRTELSMFDNYTKEFLADFNGVADANVELTGTIKKPSLKGSLTLRNTDFTVKYLNTHYRTEFCKINIAPDMISFDNVEFYDDEKNVALANGTVYHEWFSDWSIDVGLDANKFLALNTTEKDNNLYFGKAFVTGYVDIGSYEKLLTIDVKVKTEKNTTLNIPLTDNVDLVENNFIEFISKDSNKVKVDEEVDLSNIEMNFDLEITPEAKVRLVFDDQIGDVMRSTGSGNLNLQITKDGDLDMYGNYVIKDGDYLFTLQNVINKRFDLEEGGTITWTGSPYDADINITAVYRLRARLYDLLANIDTNDIYKKRIPVDLKLNMRNAMMNPDISFDISLPTADEDTKGKVRSVLYVSDKEANVQELNKQVFSLLVLNSFLPPPGAESAYDRAGVGTTTSFELLSNQLSNALSKISNDFDLGFNYRPGDELSKEEYELALSTQFFNDRLILDGNLGYSERENVSNEAQNANSLIGDISVEYKITKDGKLRVKAFNNSSQFSLVETNSAYTQGLGLSYKEEYDTHKEFWNNLFDRFRRKSKK